ncbi:SDR family NAD(P)-dependent oxidoreductase [Anaerosporobacter faecicola]|uniref:SDR family NAD(P)-dependent oxidoreductase n=1 Tax=Anaerosporobacter faecicola TaxID=2718714 RepID=UPI00143890AB|nr:SDR family NAD(P)-dependent oxidoreductase [Anaerosporobacter faecicola]
MMRKRLIVVVTGASTGIGYSLAKELAADGNRVYAGARKDEDIKRLSAIENITGVKLDITIPEQIQEAVDRIRQEEGMVDVLINNAGVTGWGAVMDRDMEYFRKVMEINFFGHVQTIKEFYPLLKKSVKNPIIINVSSQAGNYAFPYWSAYHSSKWAIEAFSHCLRREIQNYGIRVAIVQPGAIQSQAFVKDQTDFEHYKATPDSDFVKYATPMLEAAFVRSPTTKEKTPLLVVRDVKRAIYGKKNKIYYQPGRRLLPDLVAAKLPYRIVDRVMAKMQRK